MDVARADRHPQDMPSVWETSADPAALESAAGSWRALEMLAVSALTTVNDAARQVVDTDWRSDAAEAYDDHRHKVTRDLQALADLASQTATKLDGLATTCRSTQAELTRLFHTLDGIPRAVGNLGAITFHPADVAQSAQVRETIQAATPHHTHLDEELALAEGSFTTARSDLDELIERWRPRRVTMVNLNIGSGHDNNQLAGAREGVGPDDVDELAELLDRENADIVTIQETFQGDLDDLEHELEEATGDNWNIAYSEASSKYRWTGMGGFDEIFSGHLNESFGNAVLVREGDTIAGSHEIDEPRLDPEGSWLEPPEEHGPPTGTTTTTVPGTPPPPPLDPGIPDGEGRSAAHTEVEFTVPD